MLNTSGLRVVSLIPSATEVFAALITEAQQINLNRELPLLVGRSHECDRPVDLVKHAAVLTASRTTFTTSRDVDRQVSLALADSASLYTLDVELLQRLNPHVILTQDTCTVCAIDLCTVQMAVINMNTQVLCLNPQHFEAVVADQIFLVGRALQLEREAQLIVDRWMLRIETASLRVSRQPLMKMPKILFLEWLNPPYVGGHWTPEIIHMAGGSHPWNVPHIRTRDQTEIRRIFPYDGAGKSIAIHPKKLVDIDADIIIIAPCGLDLENTEKQLEYEIASSDGRWLSHLSAVKNSKVALVDGNAMFNRPGPKLVETFEWLVELIHTNNWNEIDVTYPWKQWKNTKFMPSKELEKHDSPSCFDIEELHRQACERRQSLYQDPISGLSVMTEYFLKSRHSCCGCCCRHCPYGHANVENPKQRKNLVNSNVTLQAPMQNRHSILKEGEPFGSYTSIAMMFWSGGKDSFLALSEFFRLQPTGRTCPVILLTTFNPSTGRIPMQEVEATDIIVQAKALNLPLVLVPLTGSNDYTNVVKAALTEMPSLFPQLFSRTSTTPIDSLIFGDIHLAIIRSWREEHFSDLNLRLEFPLWKRDPYTDLLPRLTSLLRMTNATLQFSAMEDDSMKHCEWKVGDPYCPSSLTKLPEGVDVMGENGEFHTIVKFN